MNKFEEAFNNNEKILMEAALAERLKREYSIKIDDDVALASLVYSEKKSKVLKKLFCEYIDIAKKYKLPIMITTPTRRANKERVLKSQYNEEIIKDNVKFLKDIRSKYSNEIYIGGLMGCYGDAYKSDDGLNINEAFEFHSWQARLFKEAKVDFLFAGIMPTINEAIGMAKAMEATDLPYIISFMIRKNGKLIDGTTISDAIKIIDSSTSLNPLFYMANCVHPDIVYEALSKPFNKTKYIKKRFKGIQGNSACLSPEELDNSSNVICSTPEDLAKSMKKLNEEFNLKIFGGCCGTDHKYLDEIAKSII